jgi:PIN domain nuclease of toxin-antitoxin system
VSQFVLDASALIAMLKGEAGASKVAESIASARMSTVNYAEVISHFVQAGMPARDVDAMLDPLPIDLVSVDKALAQFAGRLRGKMSIASLSLGDRSCLALAARDDLPAWTADKAWRTIAGDTSVKVVVIR